MLARTRSLVAAALLAVGAGSASADIDFHIGIGSSFGFCGSGIGLYSGISLGNHWGWHRPYGYRSYGYRSYGYRPAWGYSHWGYPVWHDDGWSSRSHSHRRRHHGGHHGHYGDANIASPAAITVASTHDRPVNRTPSVTDSVAVDERLAQAWALLEQGEANRAQGFFALAAVKSPDDAEAKLGFALSTAMLGDTDRAEWSANRALSVDQGELADLALGQRASITLADLLDSWEAQGSDLTARFESAMPGAITQPGTQVSGG